MPHAIHKEMDLAGRSLNYKGLAVLLRVESKGKHYYKGGLIPSTACLQRAAKVVEKKVDEVCPFTEFQSEWGKTLNFVRQGHCTLCVTLFV
jgi:hypothetical protein